LPLFVLVMALCLGGLFDRTWRHGEIFSPADAIFTAYPWAYDTSRPVPSNLSRTDEAYYHQPLMATHWARLRQGDFPEWDPTALSGTPAFFQGLNTGQAFNPISLPFYGFSAEVAVTLYAPMRLLVAALGMWVFLRHRGSSRTAAAAGALSFGLNGAFIVWLSAPMPTVASWLPWILLAIERTLERGAPRDAALLAFTVGGMLLGAYLPTSLVVLATCVTYAAVGVVAADRGVDPIASPCGAVETPFAPGAGRAARAVAAAGATGAAAPAGGSGRPGARTPTTAWRRGAALASGVLAGLTLASAGLLPMLATLRESPAAGRSVSASTLPWHNLVTLALPDFWGTPLAHNWWYAGTGNYPEFVTYLGVATLVLTGAGLVTALAARDRAALTLGVAGLLGAFAMYGVPPATWLGAVPGFRQMNPYRWNVVVACATAVLAASGLDGLRGRARTPTGRAVRAWWPLAGAVTAAAALGAVGALVVWLHLDDIRRLALQAFERRQVARFVILAVLAVATSALVVWARERTRGSRTPPAGVAGTPAGRVASCTLVALVAVDLVHFGYGFNPTLPPSRYYPWTPGLERVRALAEGGRVAPVAPPAQFVHGHVWSMFGLEVVTGFDFFGDAAYQQLIDRAGGSAPRPARWDYLGLERADTRLLGLLNVTTVVTPPECAATVGAGYATLGELTDGRRVSQEFEAEVDGLRAVDVLTAAYGRVNLGTITLTLRAPDGSPVATRTLPAADVPENAWLRLEFPPQPRRSGRWRLEVDARGAPPGRGATLWATGAPVTSGFALTIDGARDSRAIWYRAFAADRSRIPGATLLWSGDLNLYRNDAALPRAWFVSGVAVRPAAQHLDELAEPSFDLRARALLAAPLPIAATATARVLSIDTSLADERRIEVHAPEGGVLLVSERFASGWAAEVDRHPASLVRADAVLLAVGVPPGARSVRLVFHPPSLAPGIALSLLALAGIALAVLWGGRAPREQAAERGDAVQDSRY
jgi:hypothetical protein